eukprot:CAMPEP_0172437376 /NCGR_PEP_ID=MMETSP1064-20121228/72219_1 /TAXON_ID=202472 /ORGANISM="Aulacoseira subarctica , Strain CCAP 1002/5" /LENGTH=117 /DNA_ID=CAMNT_0013185835 /DNA_START=215 /DNA_END=569 /DNA_ORIENTATION=-
MRESHPKAEHVLARHYGQQRLKTGDLDFLPLVLGDGVGASVAGDLDFLPLLLGDGVGASVADVGASVAGDLDFLLLLLVLAACTKPEVTSVYPVVATGVTSVVTTIVGLAMVCAVCV